MPRNTNVTAKLSESEAKKELPLRIFRLLWYFLRRIIRGSIKWLVQQVVF